MLPTLHMLRRHTPLLAVIGLAACGAGGGGSGGSTAVTVAGGATPAPTASPTPTPTPTVTTSGGGAMPMPTPTGTSVPSPSLAGLDPIASGLNAASYLVAANGNGSIPGSDPGENVGAFRFLCAPSHNAYDDPIVYPGQPGKSHLHTFFGNTKADANSTYASLRTSGESTCNNLLNRSAYWLPAMMNGRGKVVMPDYLVVYYKRRPASDPWCTTRAKACIALPRGLRYVFGYNMSDPSKTAAGSFWWNCDGAGATSGHFATIAAAAKGCPVGARIGGLVIAPNCWNGKELDSPDHRSHMANSYYDPNDGKERCPDTHPYAIPQFTLAAWYTTDATLDRSGDESATAQTWYLASDRMPGMPAAVPGTTLHSDWWGAWEDSILALWTANCIDKLLSCNSGDLGNGQQLKGLAGYSYGNTTVTVDPPAQL